MSHWVLLVSLAVLYIAVLSVMMLLSQPIRLRLVARIDDMLDESGWNRAERNLLEWMARSNTSTVVGLMLPVAAAYSFASAVLGARLRPDAAIMRLENDKRYTAVSAYYMLSIMACSPFAAMLAVPFVLAGAAARAIRGDTEFVQMVEDPIRRAAHPFQPC